MSFLRHRRQKNGAVKLWIDALCIDQSNLTEKALQIQLMALIYFGLPRVTIWLGPEQDGSNLAMQELRDLGETYVFSKMPILSGEKLAVIEKLLKRRWWHRIWIVQEITWGGAGKKISDLWVRGGDTSVKWTNFVVAAARMKAQKNDHRQYFPAVDSILKLEELRMHSKELTEARANIRTLVELAAEYRHFQATDPWDKVYALKGLVWYPLTSIPVDYHIETHELYISFAASILAEATDLNNLCHCRDKAIPGLPSWVPGLVCLFHRVAIAT